MELTYARALTLRAAASRADPSGSAESIDADERNAIETLQRLRAAGKLKPDDLMGVDEIDTLRERPEFAELSAPR